MASEPVTAETGVLSILHTESSCGWGGQELRILGEARAVLDLGHRVHLVADPSAEIIRRAPEHGITVTALPIARKSLAGVLALRRFIAQHRFDVINTHSSTDSWLCALAAATLGHAPPLVRTRHISAPFKNNPLTRWMYNRACAAVVTTGQALRTDMIQTLGTPAGQVVSIPTGIDTGVFRPVTDPDERRAIRRELGLDESACTVGIVATLRSWKGHADLIDALHTIGADQPAGTWKLVIVGDGPQRENLQAQVSQLGLGDRVRLVGHQAAPAAWFRALDVFCLPSYANEGVPQALMQAMATGLPCVTTTAGAITEAVTADRDGLIITPRDVPALAAAINRLVAEPDTAARLGQAARARAVADFGRDRMVSRMLAVFRAARDRQPIPSSIHAGQA